MIKESFQLSISTKGTKTGKEKVDDRGYSEIDKKEKKGQN